jgi:hypothetical protein
MSADRPAALRRVPTPTSRPRRVDPQGKRSLFSEEIAPPSVGSVALHCDKCDTRSVVSMVKAAKLAFPAVYVPVPGRTDKVWMKCPACRHRGWVHVRIKG